MFEWLSSLLGLVEKFASLDARVSLLEQLASFPPDLRVHESEFMKAVEKLSFPVLPREKIDDLILALKNVVGGPGLITLVEQVFEDLSSDELEHLRKDWYPPGDLGGYWEGMGAWSTMRDAYVDLLATYGAKPLPVRAVWISGFPTFDWSVRSNPEDGRITFVVATPKLPPLDSPQAGK